MSNKVPVQNFEEFLGEDVTQSPLRTDPNSAIRMQNLEKLENGSIRGRQGCKIAAQPLFVKDTYKYIYDDDGVVTEELIGVGSLNLLDANLFRLKQGSFTVSYSGGNDWAISILPKSGNDGFELKIIESLVSTIATIDLGTGYESSPTTLKDVADTIDALTDYSCTCPQTAVVNGAQSGSKVITVDSGHDVALGDIVELVDTSVGTVIRHTDVSATTATTLTFTTEANITVTDNLVIGHGRWPAAIFDLLVADSEIVASKTLTYWYWEQIPFLGNEMTNGADFGPLTDFGYYPMLREDLPVSFANKRNCLYFTHKRAYELEYNLHVEFKEIEKIYSGVFKYDGKRVRLSGAPREDNDWHYLDPATGGASGALAAGTYYYRSSCTVCDCQGNEIEHFSEFEHILSANGSTQYRVGYPVPHDPVFNGNEPRVYGLVSATLGATATNTNTFTVTTGHKLRTGDYIFFTESANNELIRRKITSWTNTTITIDGDTVSVANGEEVSTGRFRIWRTKANVKTYFLLTEFAWPSSGTSTTFYYVDDATADSSLGIALTGLKPENLQYPLPTGNVISESQGLLTVSGGKRAAQETHWEIPDVPEFTDFGETNIPVPTRVSGDIVAANDSNDSGLKTYKGQAQYRLAGNLRDSSVEAIKDRENGYGAVNPMAITDANDAIVGVGDLGIWLEVDGQFTKNFGANYRKYFRVKTYSDTTQYYIPQTRLYYDAIKNWVHVFIPTHSTVTKSGAGTQYYINSSSKHLVFMVDSNCWANFIYDVKQYPNGGCHAVNGTFYQQSYLYDEDLSKYTGYLHKRLDGETTTASYDYNDNSATYDYDLLTAWDDDGDPERNKAWNEFYLFSLQPDYFVASFTVNFSSYRNWQISSSYIDTERTSSLVFANSSVTEKKLKFDMHKAKRRALRLYGTINQNPPIFSGYLYSLSTNQYGGGRFD